MANNINILDSVGTTKVVKTTDNSSVHTPHHNVDTVTTVASVSSVSGSVTVANSGTFAVQATQSGTWNVGVTGSLALPTGAATETTLSAINGKLPALAASGGLPVEVLQTDGFLDTGNCTTTTLGSGGVFTGTWKEVTNWNSVQVGVYSDKASATNGLNIQFSYDGTTVHHNHYYTYAGASTGISYAFALEFRYFRIVYTNTTSAQTVFKLQSILKASAAQASQYRLINSLDDETQASVTRSLIFGKTTGGGGGYVDVKVNPSGALAADVTGTVAVTGTFWQTTQPVSIASMPTTPVTGTFWQATQPVSGPLTDTQLRATAVPVSGTFWQTTQPVSLASLPALATGSNVIGAVTQSGTWNIGSITTLPALPTGSNVIGAVTQSGTWNAGLLPITSGGLSTYSFLSTAAVQSAAIKASAGQVYSMEFFNNSANAVYVRLYNQTSAPASTDTPVLRFLVPGNTSGAGFVKSWDNGIAFGTGIGIRVTAAVADNDTTALSASTILGNVEYK
jgi:hypothetical protein